MPKDLRTYLDTVRKTAPDLLVTVKREVDPKFELSSVIAKLEQQERFPIIFFEKVKGSKYPVICNLLAHRRQMAIALDTTEEKLNEVFREREGNPLPTKLVKDGPVKEVVLTGNKIDLTKLPIPTHNEKDGGPYITPGVMLARDPDTGAYNDGVYRHMLKGKRTLGIHLSPTAHGRRILEKRESRGEDLEVAIVLGHHPAWLLGSLSFVPYGTDELEVDAGIMNEPTPVVKCETVDMVVPAYAEIVIEGRIESGVRKREGPFGEYTAVYGPERMNPEINVTALTMRKDAIFYDLLTGGAEHLLWGGTPRLSQIYNTIKIACPGVKDVYMPPSGCCRFICYVSIEKIFDGEPKGAIFGAMTADPFIKYCVVVDDDVNIFSDADILHAISTRCRYDEHVFVVRNCRGNPLDPTGTIGYTRTGRALDFIVTKVGIDATKPLSGYPETIRVPGVEKVNLKDYLES